MSDKFPIEGHGLREVLFEFQHVGRFVRVCVIDPDSNTEVTLVGDPAAGQEELKRLGLQKLIYAINKNKGTQRR